MRASTGAGDICRTCQELVVHTEDGALCGCSGLSKPRPATAAARAIAGVQQLRERGVVGVFHTTEG